VLLNNLRNEIRVEYQKMSAKKIEIQSIKLLKSIESDAFYQFCEKRESKLKNKESENRWMKLLESQIGQLSIQGNIKRHSKSLRRESMGRDWDALRMEPQGTAESLFKEARGVRQATNDLQFENSQLRRIHSRLLSKKTSKGDTSSLTE